MLDRKLSVFGAQTVTDILSNYFKRLGSVLFTQIARRHRDILWQMVTKVNWYFIKPLNTRSVSKLRESQSISRSLMQKKRRKLTNEISDIKKKLSIFFYMQTKYCWRFKLLSVKFHIMYCTLKLSVFEAQIFKGKAMPGVQSYWIYSIQYD